ncbi:unnamed protein product [Urochloa humidicola]
MVVEGSSPPDLVEGARTRPRRSPAPVGSERRCEGMARPTLLSTRPQAWWRGSRRPERHMASTGARRRYMRWCGRRTQSPAAGFWPTCGMGPAQMGATDLGVASSHAVAARSPGPDAARSRHGRRRLDLRGVGVPGPVRDPRSGCRTWTGARLGVSLFIAEVVFSKLVPAAAHRVPPRIWVPPQIWLARRDRRGGDPVEVGRGPRSAASGDEVRGRPASAMVTWRRIQQPFNERAGGRMGWSARAAWPRQCGGFAPSRPLGCG